ncbi:hypothetical protein Ciccas_010949 [Cichlidogyrus casuarinus]|uniref:Uncharacterized protein n=1 Tax=Cichlidogyrus casuarinus TaxID=1844966 RepID=A0ABD2PXC6_9PLAT
MSTSDEKLKSPSCEDLVIRIQSSNLTNAVESSLCSSSCQGFEYLSTFGLDYCNKAKDFENGVTPIPYEHDYNDISKFLHESIYPVLGPILEDMLRDAKRLKKKRFGFNGLDHLTLSLYKNNPRQANKREVNTLGDIPWVSEYWAKHPRPVLPLSLQLTDDQAATIVQSFWRGQLVRRRPDVVELREWQKNWRQLNCGKNLLKQ